MMQIPLEIIPEESQLNIEELAKIINGHRFTGIICAAARLGLADLLDGEGATASELADSVKCRPDMLYRLLRALASIGIFEETPLGTFRHTRASLLLRQNAEPSLQGLASMTSLMHFYAWPEILYSLRTGKAAFNKVFGEGLYDYMADHPEAAEPFDRAMGAYTEIVTAAVLENYDFAPYSRIIDVGGGAGIFLAKILERYAHIHGTVYDRDHVVARTSERIHKMALDGRMGVQAGSFLEHVPAGADLYTIKIVLCDWEDSDVTRILKNIRRAIRNNGTLLVIDGMLPPGNTPCYAKLSDINMMLMTGGRERTEDEFRQLLSESGFKVISAKPVHEWVGLLEAVPLP
jgi:ubiquinone/menaquinone biosynthesis C-methylase UbiE